MVFENYLLSSSSLSFKNNTRYSKKCTKKQVRLFKWGYIINGNEKKLKTKNRWYIYDMNRSRIWHGYKYTKYQTYFRIMMVMYIKQYLSNIWTSIHEKVKQHWGWVEKKQKQPPEVFCKIITWLSKICLTSLIALFWNFRLFWNFPLIICNFPLLFSHSKHIECQFQ